MNDFVNPQHRGVTLPAGYKDLMDVLTAKNKLKTTVNSAKRSPEYPGFSWGYLKDVEQYLQRFLGSQFRALTFIPSVDEGSIMWFGNKGCPLAVFLFVGAEAIREKMVREIFAEFCVARDSEHIVSAGGQLVVKYPLSSALLNDPKIIIEVLRRAYGVSESDIIRFFYREREVAT